MLVVFVLPFIIIVAAGKEKTIALVERKEDYLKLISTVSVGDTKESVLEKFPKHCMTSIITTEEKEIISWEIHFNMYDVMGICVTFVDNKVIKLNYISEQELWKIKESDY